MSTWAWLDSDDGRAAVEAGYGVLTDANHRHTAFDGQPDPWARQDVIDILAAVLSATKPCPTCGGSGEDPCADSYYRYNGIPLDAGAVCQPCRGSGTVPLLVPREER